MYFNSTDFGIFFAIVLAIYWALYKNRHAQNLVVLASSMLFYGVLHYSFPIYLLALIIVSFLFGKIIEKQENEKKRKALLIPALVILSAGLIYTKYSGFILGNIAGLQHWQAASLNIIVPVGISFYTFAALGYVLEVYYEGIEAERDFFTYGAYISFFPHLLCGPIASAPTLLPQFKKPPRVSLNSVIEGIGEFLWGLFKKMIVADNISKAVSYSFSANNEDLSGSSLFVGAALFGIYVYADFSGYSSMARGCAKLLGIDLMHNFRTPMFSTSVSEYWRRWHISLTTWLNSYVYTPIVFSLKHWRQGGVIAGIFITFFISGIWHGAGWQFIIFGVVNGLAIIYEILTKKYRQKLFAKLPPIVNTIISNFIVMLFMLFSWIYFKVDSVAEANNILSRIFAADLFSIPDAFILKYIVWIAPLIFVELLQRNGNYILDLQQWLPVKVTKKGNSKSKKLLKTHITLTVILYSLIILSIYLFRPEQNVAEYYYFKF